MDLIPQVISIATVMALLATAVWWIRRRAGTARDSIGGGKKQNQARLEVVEQIRLTPQHSIHLVRWAGREMLVGLAPGSWGVLCGPFAEETYPVRNWPLATVRTELAARSR